MRALWADTWFNNAKPPVPCKDGKLTCQSKQDFAFDISLIRLEEPVGNTYGWLGLGECVRAGWAPRRSQHVGHSQHMLQCEWRLSPARADAHIGLGRHHGCLPACQPAQCTARPQFARLSIARLASRMVLHCPLPAVVSSSCPAAYAPPAAAEYSCRSLALQVSSAGYPADRDETMSRLFGTHGTLDPFSGCLDNGDVHGVVSSNLDTAGGQSGSSIWDSNNHVRAIHVSNAPSHRTIVREYYEWILQNRA